MACRLPGNGLPHDLELTPAIVAAWMVAAETGYEQALSSPCIFARDSTASLQESIAGVWLRDAVSSAVVSGFASG